MEISNNWTDDMSDYPERVALEAIVKEIEK
jgi:hypothetical protein